jgi:hypothetical protein
MGKVMERDATGRTVLIKGGRLSFGESLKDKSIPSKGDSDAKPAHGCNILLERNHEHFESNKAVIIKALQAAGEEFKKRPDFWQELWEDAPKQLCFRKGERFKNTDTGEIYAGYEGNLVVVGKGPRAGENRPVLKDRFKRDVQYEDISDVCYNGTYGDFIVSFYGTDKGGTPRITCSVEAVRSWQEGERMGGGGIDVRDDDFDDMDDIPDSTYGGGSGGSDLFGGDSEEKKSGGAFDLGI